MADEKEVKPFILADDIREVAKTEEIVQRLESVETQANKNEEEIRKIAKTDEILARLTSLEGVVNALVGKNI